MPTLCRLLLWTLLATPAWANETDQFLLPVDRPFADLGPMLSQVHLRVLDRVVASLNRRIERAQRISDPEIRAEALRRLQDPAAPADAVRARFGAGVFEMNQVEWVLHSRKAARLFPGRIIAHRSMFWIYRDVHLPVDPRKIPLLFPSSTFRLYDVYLGADKLGHFHDLGHLYFRHYLSLRRRGVEDAEAERRTVWFFSRGPISENAAIGRFATGVRSNADLAANFLGYKFYRNLTEPVMLRGRLHAPLLVRDGPLWRLNDHVLPYSDLLRPFISDHFNEALNPSQYEWSMHWSIRGRLRRQSEKILRFYADAEGRPRSRVWFEETAVELSRYYGEDYGYLGEPNEGVTIASSCFQDDDAEPLVEPREATKLALP